MYFFARSRAHFSAVAKPSKKVSIAYSQLSDKDIEEIPIHLVQSEGFLFVWVINVKYAKTLEMIQNWGYTFIDDVTWVKRTVNRRLVLYLFRLSLQRIIHSLIPAQIQKISKRPWLLPSAREGNMLGCRQGEPKVRRKS